MRTVDFAYAGARMQARYGRLLTPPQWERLQRLPQLAQYLQGARDTALKPWVLPIDAGADPHRIEAQLRAQFRRLVATLAEWAPENWQPAVLWTDVLADLPVLAHRLGGGAALPWMAADERFASLASAQVPDGEWSGELQLFADAVRDGKSLTQAWLERWRTLWPGTLPQERRALEQLVHLLEATFGEAALDGPTALAQLERPLKRLFRRHTRAPAGLFAFLALMWIELATLRGGLMRRRLALPAEGVAA